MVFTLSILSAVIMLVFALVKDQSFYEELELINSTKVSSIKYQNMKIITRELVNLANNYQNNSVSFIPDPLSTFLQNTLSQESEKFRIL